MYAVQQSALLIRNYKFSMVRYEHRYNNNRSSKLDRSSTTRTNAKRRAMILFIAVWRMMLGKQSLRSNRNRFIDTCPAIHARVTCQHQRIYSQYDRSEPHASKITHEYVQQDCNWIKIYLIRPISAVCPMPQRSLTCELPTRQSLFREQNGSIPGIMHS